MNTFTLNDHYANTSEQTLQNFVLKEQIATRDLDIANLNNILDEGFYTQPTASKALFSRNYPIENVAGSLRVNKITETHVIQKYITASNLIFIRVITSSTQGAWEEVIVTAGGKLNSSYIPAISELEGALGQLPKKSASLGSSNLDIYKTPEHCGYHIQEDDALAQLALNYPITAGGLLIVLDLGLSQIMQIYYARGSDEHYFLRTFDGSKFGSWISSITSNDLANLVDATQLNQAVTAANDYTDAQIVAVAANITQNSDDITALAAVVNANTVSTTSNDADIDALMQDVAANTANITANTASVTALDTKIDGAIADVAANTTAIATNTTAIAANTAAITDVDTKVDGAIANITALETKDTEQDTLITANADAIAALQANTGFTASDLAIQADIEADTPSKLIDADNINLWHSLKRAGFEIDNAIDLGTENLNNITKTGIYKQLNSTRAVMGSQGNYPINQEGYLTCIHETLIDGNTRTLQVYTSLRTANSYARLQFGSSWFSWEQSTGLGGYVKIADLAGKTPHRATSLASTFDLNTLCSSGKEGFYYISTATAASNAPTTGFTGTIVVYQATSSLYQQVAYAAIDEPTERTIYIRFGSSSSFSPWTRFLSTDSSLQAHKLTGVDTSGTLQHRIPTNPTLLGTWDLDTLNTKVKAGFYTQDNLADATFANNYPVEEEGFLEVFGSFLYGNNGYQIYTTYKTNRVYSRLFISGAWQAWTSQSVDLSGKTPENAIDLGTENLNTITKAGFYYQPNQSNASSSRSYPFGFSTCSMQVYTIDANHVKQVIHRRYDSGFAVTYTRVLSLDGSNTSAWSPLLDSTSNIQGTKIVNLTANTSLVSQLPITSSVNYDIDNVPSGFYDIPASEVPSVSGLPIPEHGKVLSFNDAESGDCQLYLSAVSYSVFYRFKAKDATSYHPWEPIHNVTARGASPSTSINLMTSNLDTLTSSGFYYQLHASAATVANNYPVASATGFLLQINGDNNFANCAQMFFDITSTTVYHRTCTSNVWSDWKAMPVDLTDILAQLADHDTRIETLETDKVTQDALIATKADITYVDSEVTDLKDFLMGGSVDASLDTLKEIADWIAADETASATLVTKVTDLETSQATQDTDIAEINEKVGFSSWKFVENAGNKALTLKTDTDVSLIDFYYPATKTVFLKDAVVDPNQNASFRFVFKQNALFPILNMDRDPYKNYGLFWQTGAAGGLVVAFGSPTSPIAKIQSNVFEYKGNTVYHAGNLDLDSITQSIEANTQAITANASDINDRLLLPQLRHAVVTGGSTYKDQFGYDINLMGGDFFAQSGWVLTGTSAFNTFTTDPIDGQPAYLLQDGTSASLMDAKTPLTADFWRRARAEGMRITLNVREAGGSMYFWFGMSSATATLLDTEGVGWGGGTSRKGYRFAIGISGGNTVITEATSSIPPFSITTHYSTVEMVVPPNSDTMTVSLDGVVQGTVDISAHNHAYLDDQMSLGSGSSSSTDEKLYVRNIEITPNMNPDQVHSPTVVTAEDFTSSRMFSTPPSGNVAVTLPALSDVAVGAYVSGFKLCDTVNLLDADGNHLKSFSGGTKRIEVLRGETDWVILAVNADDLESRLSVVESIVANPKVEKKTELTWSGINVVIPQATAGSTGVNILDVLPAPSTGEYFPFVNTDVNRIQVFNEEELVHFKLNLQGTSSGGFNGGLGIELAGAVGNAMTYELPTTGGSVTCTFAIPLAITRNGAITTNGFEPRLFAIDGDFTITDARLIVVQEVFEQTVMTPVSGALPFELSRFGYEIYKVLGDNATSLSLLELDKASIDILGTSLTAHVVRAINGYRISLNWLDDNLNVDNKWLVVNTGFKKGTAVCETFKLCGVIANNYEFCDNYTSVVNLVICEDGTALISGRTQNMHLKTLYSRFNENGVFELIFNLAKSNIKGLTISSNAQDIGAMTCKVLQEEAAYTSEHCINVIEYVTPEYLAQVIGDLREELTAK